MALQAGKRIVPMLLDKTPLPKELSRFNGMPELMQLLMLATRRAGGVRTVVAVALVTACTPVTACTRAPAELPYAGHRRGVRDRVLRCSVLRASFACAHASF